MIQYLLNLTAIWLLSLIVYDLFLKKEIYHGYNRAYLLTTFLAGIFLPMWQWADDSVLYSSNYGKQVIKAVSIKQDIIASATPDSSLTIENYLWYAYLTGVFAGVAILVFEILKIVYLYHGGKKSKEGKWTIIETEAGHAPFSIFHYLFVDSKEQYTVEQWQIIMSHEGYHKRSLHFIDQLLVQIGKIVFWFNPLVYVYNNRLLLVHEYQADKTSATQPQQYGQFLIEQAMLHTAPALSHSFNRSPIKKRIIMLKKKSSAWASGKKIIALPLIILCVLCFTNNVFSDDRKRDGDIITYKGNKFKLETLRDTIQMTNPETGKAEIRVTEIQRISLFNSKKIYQETPENSGAEYPVTKYGQERLEKHITNKIRTEISKLDDGTYKVAVLQIIVDENGKIVYFENDGLRRDVSFGFDVITYDDLADKEKEEKLVKDGVYRKAVYLKKIDPALRKRIEDKVSTAMASAPILKPLIVNGKKVPYLLSVEVSFGTYKINHSPTVIGGDSK